MAFTHVAIVSEQTLAKCDSEPIHIPNAIQQNGGLLVVRAGQWDIVRASQNAHMFLGIPTSKLLAMRLPDLLGHQTAVHDSIERLSLLRLSDVQKRAEVKLTGVFESLICEAHWIDDQQLVIEVELASSPDETIAQWKTSLECVERITNAAEQNEGLQRVLEAFAISIKTMTNYDRVMIYQIDEDGQGRIVEEAKQPHLEDLVGVRFPESNVSKQVRALYMKNRVRMLTDFDNQQIQILCRDLSQTTALDMSLCHLHNIPPIHVEYLQNMGVIGTMVISIVVDNQLWGLVACHHHEPKRIDARLRNLCEGLARFTSLAIRSEQQRETRHAIESSQELRRTLEHLIGCGVGWFRNFLDQEVFLLNAMKASGAVVCVDTRKYSLGDAPDGATVDLIRRNLKALGKAYDLIDHNQTATCSLQTEFSELSNVSAEHSGCLMSVISQQPPFEILWFRHAVQGHSLPWSIQDSHRSRAIASFVSSQQIGDVSRLKSQFLANMSHEIRTPLTAIVGYAETLMENTPGLMASALHTETINAIRRNSEHLFQVTDDILDASKIEAGKLTIHNSQCSLREIVMEVESLLRVGAEKKSIAFRLDAKNPIPKMITTDPVRLRQILLNLSENAIKFTEKGSVSLETVYRQDAPAWIEFLIQDSGQGIDPDVQNELFRPFVQADNSMTRKQRGTGLGLYISRQLARLMGGEVDMRSSILGIGTTLGVKLPIGIALPVEVENLFPTQVLGASSSISDVKQSFAGSNQGALSLTGIRLLLAEDGVDNQLLISYMVKKNGAEITVVENGQLAIEAYEAARLTERPFDVVLMDMQMPVLDGYSATRMMRQRGYQIPIIAVTAHAMPGDRDKCIDAGCSDYLTKPVERKKLTDAILSGCKQKLAN